MLPPQKQIIRVVTSRTLHKLVMGATPPVIEYDRGQCHKNKKIQQSIIRGDRRARWRRESISTVGKHDDDTDEGGDDKTMMGDGRWQKTRQPNSAPEKEDASSSGDE